MLEQSALYSRSIFRTSRLVGATNPAAKRASSFTQLAAFDVQPTRGQALTLNSLTIRRLGDTWNVELRGQLRNNGHIPYPFIPSTYAIARNRVGRASFELAAGSAGGASNARITSGWAPWCQQQYSNAQCADGSSNTSSLANGMGFPQQRELTTLMFELLGVSFCRAHNEQRVLPTQSVSAEGRSGINNYCYHQMSSYHTDGIQVLMMDGSVRFISNNINSGNPANWDALPDFSDASARAATYGVWQSICDMSEGNVVGEF